MPAAALAGAAVATAVSCRCCRPSDGSRAGRGLEPIEAVEVGERHLRRRALRRGGTAAGTARSSSRRGRRRPRRGAAVPLIRAAAPPAPRAPARCRRARDRGRDRETARASRRGWPTRRRRRSSNRAPGAATARRARPARGRRARRRRVRYRSGAGQTCGMDGGVTEETGWIIRPTATARQHAACATTMRMAIIECVPNVSEGRRPDVVRAIVDAVAATPGCPPARLVVRRVAQPSVSSRSPATPRRCKTAVLTLFERSLEAIDLRQHQGEHPRLGAVDVVPFVPIEGVTMADCVQLARETGAGRGRPLRRAGLSLRGGGVDARAAQPRGHPARRVRRAGREDGATGMAARLRARGPARERAAPPSSARACRSSPTTSTSATDRLDVAKKIAAAIRFSSGGLRFVKAMGIALEDRGIVQVSMNLTNYEKTPIFRVFEIVRREAARYGVTVLESEIVGLVPSAALVVRRPVVPAARGLHAATRCSNTACASTARGRRRPAEVARSGRSRTAPTRRPRRRPASPASALRAGAMPNARIFRYRLLRSTPSASAVRDMLPCCAASTRRMYCCSKRSRAVWSGSTSPPVAAGTWGVTTSRLRNATSLSPMVSPGTMIIRRSITFRSSRTFPGHG